MGVAKQNCARYARALRHLSNFLDPPLDTSWRGPPFHTHVGGYKLCLEFDANGFGSGKGSHVSVFIFMMKGEFDDRLKWPFRGEITIQLVNQKEGGEHIGKKVKSSNYRSTMLQRVTEAQRGWGYGNSYPTLISIILMRARSI